jgi:hypothetical protein
VELVPVKVKHQDVDIKVKRHDLVDRYPYSLRVARHDFLNYYQNVVLPIKDIKQRWSP